MAKCRKSSTHVTALENENKALKAEAKKKESDDARDCESNTVDKNHDNLSVALPIPKPSGKSSKFANLHLKLNLEKNIYKNYRATFYRFIEHHTPIGIQYKNLDKNIRAKIIPSSRKLILTFLIVSVIGPYQLYFIGENARRQDKKSYIENKVQSVVRSMEGRINQPSKKHERKCTQKKMTSTNHYSESHEDSYDSESSKDNVEENKMTDSVSS
ncbi:435_t:CDS:2 [Funneliformis caledonium]|uniref:435_t:CDS:1 n=1 Tax=Funneliformis caledonium TaxID=1117310 RepID=A0A9N9A1D6_9GLOM|nr:435_t:CDS:2 [Funneliformis caledonium]